MTDTAPMISVVMDQVLYGSGESFVRRASARVLAQEIPVNIAVDGIPFAVMMASPCDLADFGYGFAVTEGLVSDPSEILGISAQSKDPGILLDLNLTAAALQKVLAQGRGRAISGRTGCGLCGVQDFSGLPQTVPKKRDRPVLNLPAIRQAVDRLAEAQPLNAATHAVHGAAMCTKDGTIVLVREDVGRHNALDKLIGAMIREGRPAGDGFIVITSRCSFEMVEKAAIFGIGTLVSISAPTNLALQRAEVHGMNLVSLARQDGAAVFVDSTARCSEDAA